MPTIPRPDFAPAGPRSDHRRRLRTGVAVLTAAVVAVATLGLRPLPVVADGVTPLPDITFYGRGYGHGVGMSQYGARGRALIGQLAPEILAHYYTGTTLGTSNPATIVRVLVLNGFVATPVRPATIVGRGGPWTIDGVARLFPVNSRLILVPTAPGATTWSLRVRSSIGLTIYRAVVSRSLVVRPASPTSLLQLVPKAAVSNLYRGLLRVRLTATVAVINHVPLDTYLRGVIPLEMPAAWPAEALKAQAIAARSYALRRIHPTIGTYDIYDDTRAQVYRGQRAENPATDAAIAATSGVVLMSGTTIANALFHSADGGWTENNENVFVSPSGAIVAGPVSYLRGSSDRAPDGASYDQASPYATWRTGTYTADVLSAILATDARTNVGTLASLDLSRRGVSGRLIRVTIVGSLGTKSVSGDVFKVVFNAGKPVADPPLRGTLFDIQPIP